MYKLPPVFLTQEAAKFSSIWVGSGGCDGGVGADLQAWPLLLSRAGVSAALRQFTHAGRLRARLTAVDDECHGDGHDIVNLKSFAMVQSQAAPWMLEESHNNCPNLIYSHVCTFSVNPNLEQKQPFSTPLDQQCILSSSPEMKKTNAQPFHDNHTSPCEQKSGLMFSFVFDIFIISLFSPQIVEFLKTAKQKQVGFCRQIFSNYVNMTNWSLHHLSIVG